MNPRPESGPAVAESSERGKWMTLVAAFLGWMFDGFEMGLFPLVGRPALVDLLGSSDSKDIDPWFGLMIAVFLIGAATGGVVFGWLGDRIGRVRAMALSVLTYALFMGLCGLAPTLSWMVAFRFVSSLGMGGEWSLGVALVMEIWPNKTRGLLAGLIGAASNVGFLLIALIGLGLAGVTASLTGWLQASGLPEEWVSKLTAHSAWRLMMLIGALPALLTFLIRLLVPESERWLHEKSKGTTSNWATKDMLTVLFGAAGAMAILFLWMPKSGWSLGMQIGGSLLGLAAAIVGFLYPVMRFVQRSGSATGNSATASASPIVRRMLLGACLSGVALLGTWGSIQWAPSWARKLEQKRIAELPEEERAAVKTAPQRAASNTQICSAIGAILGTMAGALLGNAIGRRPTYALLCLGSLGSSLVLYLGNAAVGPMFFAAVLLAGGVTASFYGWLPLYLPELFPTRVRATGQGFSFNFGRILAAVGALQTGQLTAFFQDDFAKAGSAMSVIYLLGVLLIWLGPETRGQPLPE